MTDLEAKARDCIENHIHKLIEHPTEQDIYTREESIYISGYKAGMEDVKAQWKEYYMICSSPCCGIDGIKVTGKLGQCVKTEDEKYEN